MCCGWGGRGVPDGRVRDLCVCRWYVCVGGSCGGLVHPGIWMSAYFFLNSSNSFIYPIQASVALDSYLSFSSFFWVFPDLVQILQSCERLFRSFVLYEVEVSIVQCWLFRWFWRFLLRLLLPFVLLWCWLVSVVWLVGLRGVAGR